MLPDDPHPKLAALQAQIQALSDLYNRLPALRQIPLALLKPSLLPIAPTSRTEFHQLQEIGDTILSDPVQEALRAARDSLKLDATDLNSNPRRESRKRRRPPSPESPKPYVAVERKTASLFPLTIEDGDALRKEGLADYIRTWNRDKKNAKLHLWRRTHGPLDGQLTVLRFMIPDVLTVYVTLVIPSADSALVAESLAAFAPREKKSPHSQSDYVVYQSLSQQLAKMVQSYPSVSVQSILGVLCAYEGLFVDRCTVCERVLSAEGHVPPVVRIWGEGDKEREGQWEARHVGC